MTDKHKQTEAKQKIVGSKLKGHARQVNNADVSEQTIADTTGASADQVHQSEGGFRLGTSSASGRYGIIALAILLAVVAIVGLLKVAL